jgi:hypothetical protein
MSTPLENASEGTLSALDNAILEPAENFFDSIGCMQGPSAPLKRAAIGAGLGYAIAYGLKPNFAFKNGEARPWKVTASGDDAADATWFPAWAIAVFPAFVFGAMI